MKRTFCSEANAQLNMLGTAEHVDLWLMLEYRPAWNAKAVDDNALSAASVQWLRASMSELQARGFRVRAQFVRQPEIDSPQVRLLVGVNGQLWQLSGRGYDFLGKLSLGEFVAHPTGQMLTSPQYFVCTNGQRDLCCARFGLPTYHAMRELVGANVWQVTHLGGHRFAPNVLALPEGVMYGRVTPAEVADFVATVQTRRSAFDFLRGRTIYPGAVQAAEGFLAVDGLRLLHVEQDDSVTHVQFDGGNCIHRISVRQVPSPVPVLTSCGAELKTVYPYERV